MRSFKCRDRPDMQHKLSSSICPILLNFVLSFCYVIIWGKLQPAVSPISQYVNTLIADSSWNVMAHGNAREGKWRGNWWMQWVASTLHTTSEYFSWNVMAHGNAREGKWRGNWWMQCVASTTSHYLGTWCIQHYYRWCAHLGCQQSTELTPI